MSTAVYVNRHFEVRDRDQPVKYVFDGDTRVARITGSLSSNSRVQRLRLRPGWNLVSLAVNATNLAGQMEPAPVGPSPLLLALYRWNPATAGYESVAGGETVTGASVLWVRAATNRTVAVRGEFVPPPPPTAPAGGGYVPGPGFEAWAMPSVVGATIWRFDAAAVRWESSLAGDLATGSDLPPTLPAGEALYVQTASPAGLVAPDPGLQVTYYHADHLGSTAAMTDAAGQLLRETAYHPFGVARHEVLFRELETAYGFTGKERDPESGLSYFEARYLAGPLGRFTSTDPKYREPDQLRGRDQTRFTLNPQTLNLYAYVNNNPLRYTDPSGLDSWPDMIRRTALALEVRMILSSTPTGSRLLKETSVNIVIDSDKGDYQRGDTIHLSKHAGLPSLVDHAAHELGHEHNRAAGLYQSDVKTQSREDFVDTEIMNETTADITRYQIYRELADKTKMARHAGQDEYDAAVSPAAGSGAFTSQAAHDANVVNVVKQRRLDSHTLTSTTDEPYVEYYGGRWDRAHPE